MILGIIICFVPLLLAVLILSAISVLFSVFK